MARRVWTTAMVLALCCLSAPAAHAGDKIVVTTLDDVDAAQASTELALRACAGETYLAGGVVTAGETTANHQLNSAAGADTAPDPQVTPCSFRLALLAAAANQPATQAEDRDTIVFSKSIFLDPAVDPELRFASVPLPPITDPYLAIDGCGDARGTQTMPCVNMEFPSLPIDSVSSLLDRTPGSLLPREATGLTVLAPQVSISGIAFANGDPAVWLPPAVNPSSSIGVNSGLSVTNCFFGLDATGTPTGDSPGTALLVSGDHARIGLDPSDDDPPHPLRNVFAQGGTGILVAGAADTKIEGNLFGTGPDGKVIADDGSLDPLQTGIRIVGLGADATPVADALFAAPDEVDVDDLPEGGDVPLLPSESDRADADSAIEDNGSQSTASGTKIGAAPTGTAATTSACDGPCNLFAGVVQNAIDLGGRPVSRSGATLPNSNGEPAGAEGTRIKGNQFGVDSAGTAAGTEDAAILIQNGTKDTTVGGETPTEMNLISNSGAAGVAVEGDAGLDTTFARNTGTGNLDVIFDLGADGAGNARALNGGIAPPVVKTADPGSVSGTTQPGRLVRLFRVPAQGDGFEAYLGSATAGDDGTWKATSPVQGGERVTATVEGQRGTSEPAAPVTVTMPPPPKTDEEPPQEEPQEPAPVTEPVESPAPPPPPPDTAVPTVVTVAGETPPEPGSKRPIAVSRSEPLAGLATDPSGIREVFVALALPPRRHAAASRRRCRFVDIRRSRVVRRRCSRPLFFHAQGTDEWKLPLKRKTRTILARARFVTLYLEITDNAGNTALQRYRIKFGKRRRSLGA